MKTNIRKDLIEDELSKNGYICNKFNLHNSLISKLKHHYKLHELCINSYDSEPDYDDEEFNRYMTYCSILKKEYCKYHHTDCSEEELKQAYYHILQQKEEYEPQRLSFCNWQEPIFEGAWWENQKTVDEIGQRTLKEIQKFNVSKKDRLYIGYKDDYIIIYFYGRDFQREDYWFIYERR